MPIELNCDNCNRLFRLQPNKLSRYTFHYCCTACCHEHRKYNRVVWGDISYRKLKFYAYLRELESRNGVTG